MFSGRGRVVGDPAWTHKVFNTTTYAWLWGLIRLYVGWQWLEAGWHKVLDPKYVVTGEGLKGYWARVIAVPATGKPPITYDWYRGFLSALYEGNNHVWFGKLIAYGEFLVGIALILGLFTGFAAFGGAFMNMNFMLAGSASTNPVLFFFAVMLILAWKVAGFYGLDYWVLPRLGTPWTPAKDVLPLGVPVEHT